MRRCLVALLVVALTASACSDDDAAPPDTTTTTIAAASERRYEATIAALADDAMEGRDNQTPGSALAQDHLVDQLSDFAEPLVEDFRQPFAEGTNVLAVIPGGELTDEYVVLGAHYDHLGRDCPTSTPGDDVCNGAADNAAGVAAVLEIGRRLAEDGPPRRSVILAFWDAEEDGLLGAEAYVDDPPVPLDQTTAYLNWDIQGVNLLPSLATTTVVVGAETGGPALVEAATTAAEASALDPLPLSLLFGQGRSDHAVFVGAGVPSVFFTDANSGCYHTSQDDLAALDLDKLAQQITIGEALARDQVGTDTPPTFDPDAPAATYDDAGSMLAVVTRAEPDVDLFPAEGQAAVRQFITDLEAIRDAGAEAFDDTSVGVLLGGSAQLVELLADSTCASHRD